MKIIENFVDQNFEDEIIKMIPEKISKTKDRNQVIRYGTRRPYPSDIKSDIIPDLFLSIKDIKFDSVTINEYKAGQKIDWHIDRVDAGNDIYIISLLSTAVLKFRKDNEVKEFPLPRYSLAIMSDELRYEWEHGLFAPLDRISVVFRNSNK